MPITGPIPLPGDPGSAFLESFKAAQDYKNSLSENQLRQAQAQQQQSQATQQNMISQLMKIAYPELNQQGPIQPGQQVVQNNSSIQPGQQTVQQSQQSPDAAERSAKAKQILQAFGALKPTVEEQAEIARQTAWQNAVSSADVDQMKDWNKTITSGHEMMPVMQNIQDITANPTFQEMYKNPEYFGKDIQYLSRFGTPEQQTLIAGLGTNIKSIYSSMGQDFKGAFRQFEYKIFNAATPQPTDTLPQIIAKNNTLLSLKKLVTDRLSLANNIVRSSQGKISPSSALDIADKQINSKQIAKEIQNKFEQSQEVQKMIKDKSEKNEMISITNKKTGETKMVSKEEARKLGVSNV